MDTKRICSVCGKPLAPDTPEGLCPECLLKAGIGTGVDLGTETETGGGKRPRFTPPEIKELAAKFPQLEILGFIGQGGMGAVYKARQKQLDRVVALKILPPQAGAGGPAFAERFAREARALAKLNHPHIVTLYEFGQSDGLFYFLMEFVDGMNLRQLLANSRISPHEALAIVPQICEALQFAHDSGIVHRDIKPENILLDKKGLVKIADFGVAKMIAESLTEAAGNVAAAPGELTEAGSTLGTPQYMAPEQIKNSAEVDHRADIYSVGVVFYQMLTGELPSGKIAPPSRKVRIDVRLDEVVLRALEKEPQHRYQHVSDVKSAVETIAGASERFSGKTSIGFKRFGIAGVIALFGIILAAAVVSLSLRTVRPAAQNVLSEAAFLQKFDSNLIAQATITYPAVSGGPSSINGKFLETDAHGEIVQQNGHPVEESFVVPDALLTPGMEDKLLPSDKVSVKIPNSMVGDIGYQLLLFALLPIALLFIAILIIYLIVRKIISPNSTNPTQQPSKAMSRKTIVILLVVFVIGLLAVGAIATVLYTRLSAPRTIAPLPNDFTIQSPSSDVSAQAAGFSGAWVGAWGHQLAGALIVEDISASGTAHVIYSWGNAPWFKAGCVNLTGTISNADLRLDPSFGPHVSYTLQPDGTLAGIYQLPNMPTIYGTLYRVDSTKVADIRKAANNVDLMK